MKVDRLQILVIGSSTKESTSIARQFAHTDYVLHSERVATPAGLRAALAATDWDCVVAYEGTPNVEVGDTIGILREFAADVPLILMAATSRAGATAAGRARSDTPGLVALVERAMRDAALRSDSRRARLALREESEIADALAQIGRSLSAVVTDEALWNRLSALVQKWIGSDFGHLFLHDAQTQAYAAVSGYGAPATTLDASTWLPWVAALGVERSNRNGGDGILLVNRDAETNHSLAEWLRAYDCGVGLMIPLFVRGQVVGLQTICYRSSRVEFTTRQRRIAAGLAQFASLAIESWRLVDALDRANRLKDDFVATMSHELRTPLNIIIGYSDLLQEEAFGRLSDEQSEILGHVRRSSRDLLAMIESTLDVSRMNGGNAHVETVPVVLADLFASVDAELRQYEIARPATIEYVVQPDIPELRTDPGKLKVILHNLLGNAIKFAPAGAIVVDASPRAGGVEIAVRDNGIGIPATALEEIFEPFRQVENPMRHQTGGVGLGLYITKRLTELLGGRISVESELGHGAAFRIELPVERRT